MKGAGSDNQLQQHIQTVREGLERRTQGELNIEGKELWVRRQQYGGENSHVWIGDIPNPDNMHLFANSPTWLQTSIEIIEQQQREIERLRQRSKKLHETINTYWQGDCDKATVIKAQSSLCDALSPKEDQTPPEMGMTRSDRSQIDDLIKEYGADFILDYVNDYAEKEVLGDV